MNDAICRRASLWRETLRDFWTFMKAEWLWLAFFVMIFAIKQHLGFLNYDLQEISAQLKGTQNDPVKSAEILQKYFPIIFSSWLANMAIMLLSVYTYTVLYFRRFAHEKAPGFSLKNFFYWLWKIIQKYFLLISPLFLFAFVCGTAFTLLKSFSLAQEMSRAVSVGLTYIWVFYFICGFYSLCLVSPLAVLRIEPVLKTCFQMTKKHLWRIFWESTVVLVITLGAYFPLHLVGFSVSLTFGMDSVQAHESIVLLSCALTSMVVAAMAVYACVVYRVLSQEQKDF
jgi:hypothetical protein